ncbi:STAS domain-containing protein [Roseicitreum antarcticum]|uniref:Anti-sigma B factor antagonist n=1 Tax=Roseicitreum antarcticum TaxID=564137 RepID=A0A1H2SAW6_9RHOB|nr:STAS domain-containing protein [Roseicitreum antarcticum]SDW28720.1 anti-sigma B factor antagonist [Roseicitreum antarcticum]
MNLEAKYVNKCLNVTVCESRLDAAVAIVFKEQMRAFTEGGSGAVILDLSQVSFIDSSGLGAVVAVMKLLGPERPLELAGLTANVAKVFRLTRMEKVFTIHPVHAAPASMQATG